MLISCGTATIDAEVIIWKAQPPFPWEISETAVARQDFKPTTELVKTLLALVVFESLDVHVLHLKGDRYGTQ